MCATRCVLEHRVCTPYGCMHVAPAVQIGFTHCDRVVRPAASTCRDNPLLLSAELCVYHDRFSIKPLLMTNAPHARCKTRSKAYASKHECLQQRSGTHDMLLELSVALLPMQRGSGTRHSADSVRTSPFWLFPLAIEHTARGIEGFSIPLDTQ